MNFSQLLRLNKGVVYAEVRAQTFDSAPKLHERGKQRAKFWADRRNGGRGPVEGSSAGGDPGDGCPGKGCPGWFWGGIWAIPTPNIKIGHTHPSSPPLPQKDLKKVSKKNQRRFTKDSKKKGSKKVQKKDQKKVQKKFEKGSKKSSKKDLKKGFKRSLFQQRFEKSCKIGFLKSCQK